MRSSTLEQSGKLAQFANQQIEAISSGAMNLGASSVGKVNNIAGFPEFIGNKLPSKNFMKSLVSKALKGMAGGAVGATAGGTAPEGTTLQDVLSKPDIERLMEAVDNQNSAHETIDAHIKSSDIQTKSENAAMNLFSNPDMKRLIEEVENMPDKFPTRTHDLGPEDTKWFPR